MTPAQSPVQPGDVVAGKYRVERVLGQGGMGVVVAATHLDLLEPRALKFMLPTALPDAETVERFLREARAASRLKSEHVARVHDVGRTEAGIPYIVMEYLDGVDLAQKLRREGARPVHEAVLYILQAAEALAEAHAAGIVHRDLKPGNLFITQRPDGTPHIKVLDFGISKITGADAGDLDVTKTHTVLGSPLYMAPEQMQSSRDVDARSDIWSLGVILYGLLTGQLPYRGKSLTEMVAAVFTTKPTPPGQLAPHVPPGLEAAVLRCLERDRDARFSSVGELAESLRPYTPPFASFLVDRILRVSSAGGRRAMPSFAGMPGELPPGYTPAPPGSSPYAAPPPAPSHPSGVVPPPAPSSPSLGGAYAYAPTPSPSSRSGAPGYTPLVSSPPGIPTFGGSAAVPPPAPSSPSGVLSFGGPTPYPQPSPSSPSNASPYGGPTPFPPPSSPSAASPFGPQGQLPPAMSASGAWGTTAAGIAPRRSRAALIAVCVGGVIATVIVTLSILTRGPSTAASPEVTAIPAAAAAPSAAAEPAIPAPTAPAPPTASAILAPQAAQPEPSAATSAQPAKPKKPISRPADPFGMDRK